jgi:hypothetical protein
LNGFIDAVNDIVREEAASRSMPEATTVATASEPGAPETTSD